MKAAELFEFTKTTAQKTFNKDGHHSPIFIIDSPTRGPMIVLAMWDSTEEKYRVMERVRLLMKQHFANQYAFVNEMWMSKNEGIAPSDDPDRKEGLMIIVESKSEQPRGGIYPIIRPKVGKPRLGAFKDYSDETFGGIGAFANMLGIDGLMN